MAQVSGSTKPDVAQAPAPPPLTRLHDALAGELILRHVPGRRVLDLGYGSPRIAEWVAERTGDHLSIAEKAALESSEGPLHLDYPDQQFDTVYSIRTLPHLGTDAESSERLTREVLAEAARLTRHGGALLLEIANPTSLRGALDGIRNPVTVVAQAPRGSVVVGDRHHVTRYDTLRSFYRLVPPELTEVEVHGIGVVVVSERPLQVPLVGSALSALEWWARDSAFVRHLGATLLLVLRRT